MKRLLGWSLLVLLVAAAGWSGVVLRHNLWNWTMNLRFNGDIDNGYHWGKFADHVGYFNVYDELGTQERGGELLDYGPLRLGVMSTWVQWLKPRYSIITGREPTFEFHSPLLWFNTSIEIATALAAWLLTAHLVRRDPKGAAARGVGTWLPRGVLAGFISALLIWFNPLILWNAHTWPQWDIWPMPFYLFAAYFGCHRRWLLGGLLIGVGALLKGQMLMVAWTLPLWALCLGDWRGSLRFVFGAVCAIAVVGCVWELSIYLPGPHQFDHALASHQRIRQINWPAVAWAGMWTGAALFLPRRWSAPVICTALGVSLFSTLVLFGGSTYWLQAAFGVGTWHFPTMAMGTTSNLPAMLEHSFGYHSPEYICYVGDLPRWTKPSINAICNLFSGDPPVEIKISIRTLMLIFYFSLCSFSAIFAAINDRRGDPRLAISIGLPWLLFFCLPLQIHERYMLFFSACAALLVATGFGYTLLGFVVTLVGLTVTMHTSLAANGIPSGNGDRPYTFLPALHAFVAGTHPGIAWLLLLALTIFLYSIVPPTRATRRFH